jgi:hypothetical protein
MARIFPQTGTILSPNAPTIFNALFKPDSFRRHNMGIPLVGFTMRRATAFASLLILALPATADAASQPVSQAPVLGAALSPYTATTAGDFAAGCKVDASSCAAMVGQVLMNRIQFSPTSHICLPGVNYADRVPAWLNAHPEMAGMPAHDGIYLAITSLYRCGAPSNY